MNLGAENTREKTPRFGKLGSTLGGSVNASEWWEEYLCRCYTGMPFKFLLIIYNLTLICPHLHSYSYIDTLHLSLEAPLGLLTQLLCHRPLLLVQPHYHPFELLLLARLHFLYQQLQLVYRYLYLLVAGCYPGSLEVLQLGDFCAIHY